jgi:hypothetical protein
MKWNEMVLHIYAVIMPTEKSCIKFNNKLNSLLSFDIAQK